MGSNSSGSFALVLMKCASLGGVGWHFSWTQVPFSLVSFFFDHCPSHVSGIYLSTLILLARILSLFVYSDANRMLGNIVDSPSFVMVTFVGHSFLNSTHSLDIYITLLVDSHVCGQRNNSMFSERPREHRPLALCVGHFDELAWGARGEIWSSGRRTWALAGRWRFRPKGACLILFHQHFW